MVLNFCIIMQYYHKKWGCCVIFIVKNYYTIPKNS
jgi:hypothetical protein